MSYNDYVLIYNSLQYQLDQLKSLPQAEPQPLPQPLAQPQEIKDISPSKIEETLNETQSISSIITQSTTIEGEQVSVLNIEDDGDGSEAFLIHSNGVQIVIFRFLYL